METKPPPVMAGGGGRSEKLEERRLFCRDAVGGFVLVGGAVIGLRISDIKIGRLVGEAAIGKLAFKTICCFPSGGSGVRACRKPLRRLRLHSTLWYFHALLTF